MASLNISTEELPEPTSLGPVPQGEYLCEIVESDVTETATSQGRRVLLTFQVIDGDFAGAHIWERADIDRVSISKRDGSELRIDAARFNSLMKALNVGVLDDTAQLHGLPVMVRVVVEQREGYNPKNEIKGYRAAGHSAPAPVARPAPAARPAPVAQARPAPATSQGGSRPVPAFLANRR